MSFVALGGVWLDEICTPGKPALKDVPGGSILFATFGARIFSKDSKKVSLAVKAGSDFPAALLDELATWHVNLHVLDCPNFPSARGRMHYGENAADRVFERLTPPLSTTPSDLVGTGLLSSECFHLFDSASGANSQIDELLDVRIREGTKRPPFVIWEPHAKSCTPETFEEHRALVNSNKIQVFSPNHVELDSFFRGSDDASDDQRFDKKRVEDQAHAFLPRLFSGDPVRSQDEAGNFFPSGWPGEAVPIADSLRAFLSSSSSASGAQSMAHLTTEIALHMVKNETPQSPESAKRDMRIIIRCAEHGCFLLFASSFVPDGKGIWLPSYYRPSEAHRVVDPTGAGNAFLGGVAVGWLETGNSLQAAKYGTVAASFALEAVGLPDVEKCDARGRLVEYEASLMAYWHEQRSTK